MRKVATLVGALAIAGCAAPVNDPVLYITNYDPGTTEWSRAKGASVVTGQAVMRTRGGAARNCAGLQVHLIPDSRYAIDRFNAQYGASTEGFLSVAQLRARRVKFVPDDPLYYAHTRTETCDSQGNFRFDNVPAGVWRVQTIITWEAGRYSTQGGSMFRRILVKEGEPRHVVLAPS